MALLSTAAAAGGEAAAVLPHMRPRRTSALRLSPTRHCLPAVALLVFSLHVLLACRIGNLSNSGYRLTPLNHAFGMEVRGADLNADLNADLQQRIREDLTRHRLLLFRGQGVIPGERLVEIGGWLGEVKNGTEHPRAPCPGVTRISNDKSEGITGIGRGAWWHCDGAYFANPAYYALYHIINATDSGSTLFAPLSEVVASLAPEQRRRWERLAISFGAPKSPVNPLITSHPITDQPTLLFSTGFMPKWIWDAGTPRRREADDHDRQRLLAEFRRTLQATFDDQGLVYNHTWRPGDIIFADNRAVAHLSPEEAHQPREQAGLRVLHRVLITGPVRPWKSYRIGDDGSVLDAGA